MRIYAQMFQTMVAESTLRNPNSNTDISHVQWFARVFSDDPLEPTHDCHTLVTRSLIHDSMLTGQTSDHGPNQRIFECRRNFGCREDIGASRGEISGRPVQIHQS